MPRPAAYPFAPRGFGLGPGPQCAGLSKHSGVPGGRGASLSWVCRRAGFGSGASRLAFGQKTSRPRARLLWQTRCRGRCGGEKASVCAMCLPCFCPAVVGWLVQVRRVPGRVGASLSRSCRRPGLAPPPRPAFARVSGGAARFRFWLSWRPGIAAHSEAQPGAQADAGCALGFVVDISRRAA